MIDTIELKMGMALERTKIKTQNIVVPVFQVHHFQDKPREDSLCSVLRMD